MTYADPTTAAKQKRKRRQASKGVAVTATGAGGTVLQEGFVSTRARNAAQPRSSPDPEPVSSQSVIELEDTTGQVWDGYRLAESPSGTKFVRGGQAYFDQETKRLHVARPRSTLGKNSLEDGEESPATRIRKEDEEAYRLQDSEVCRSVTM